MLVKFSNYNKNAPKTVFIYDSGEDTGHPPEIRLLVHHSTVESSLFKFTLPTAQTLQGHVKKMIHTAVNAALDGQFSQAASLFVTVITEVDKTTSIVRRGVSNRETCFLRIPKTSGGFVDVYLTSERK